MNINFSIEENIYIKSISDELFDLHNEYDFIKHEVSYMDKKVSLVWRNTEDKNILILEHINVDYLVIDSNSLGEDANTLSTVSYFSSKDRSTNDSITSNSIPDKDDDIIYYFENENFIRISCDKIKLKLRPHVVL